MTLSAEEVYLFTEGFTPDANISEEEDLGTSIALDFSLESLALPLDTMVGYNYIVSDMNAYDHQDLHDAADSPQHQFYQLLGRVPENEQILTYTPSSNPSQTTPVSVSTIGYATPVVDSHHVFWHPAAPLPQPVAPEAALAPNWSPPTWEQGTGYSASDESKHVTQSGSSSVSFEYPSSDTRVASTHVPTHSSYSVSAPLPSTAFSPHSLTAISPDVPHVSSDNYLSWKAGFELGQLSANRTIRRESSSSYQSSTSEARQNSSKASRSSQSSYTRRSSSASLPLPSKRNRRSGSRSGRTSTSSEVLECNEGVVNEYEWLRVTHLDDQTKAKIVNLAEDKRVKSPQNDQHPDTEAVLNVLDIFSQQHVPLKLSILNILYGTPLTSELPLNEEGIQIPKMTFREATDGIDILLQTSNGYDAITEDITNPDLTGLRYCRALRNQICKSRSEVPLNADKRPHNSWFLYRGAQMTRSAILTLTSSLPNDLSELQRLYQSLKYGMGVHDRSIYLEELRSTIPNPAEVKTDLTAIGYVVSYMWALESQEVKLQVTEFSKREHAHKLKVFPGYRYAPKKPSTKRNHSTT